MTSVQRVVGPRPSSRIGAPFTDGQRIRIPAGTPVRRRGQITRSRRARTITVHTVSNGWVNLSDGRRGFGCVTLPRISWAGSGGYWQYAQVTEALCAANNVAMPALPQFTDQEQKWLDVIPSYGLGYDDRWTAEQET